MRWRMCDGWCFAGNMGVGVGAVLGRWVPVLPHAKHCVSAYLFFSMVGIYGIYGCGWRWTPTLPCV